MCLLVIDWLLHRWASQQKSNLVSYPRAALTDVGSLHSLSLGKACRILVLAAPDQREAEYKSRASRWSECCCFLHRVELFHAPPSLSSWGHHGFYLGHWHLFPCYINRAISTVFSNWFLKIFILFLAALGLHCCTRAFSSCGEPRQFFVSLCSGFSCCRAQVLGHIDFNNGPCGLSHCSSQALDCRLTSCGTWA